MAARGSDDASPWQRLDIGDVGQINADMEFVKKKLHRQDYSGENSTRKSVN